MVILQASYLLYIINVDWIGYQFSEKLVLTKNINSLLICNSEHNFSPKINAIKC